MNALARLLLVGLSLTALAACGGSSPGATASSHREATERWSEADDAALGLTSGAEGDPPQEAGASE